MTIKIWTALAPALLAALALAGAPSRLAAQPGGQLGPAPGAPARQQSPVQVPLDSSQTNDAQVAATAGSAAASPAPVTGPTAPTDQESIGSAQPTTTATSNSALSPNLVIVLIGAVAALLLSLGVAAYLRLAGRMRQLTVAAAAAAALEKERVAAAIPAPAGQFIFDPAAAGPRPWAARLAGARRDADAAAATAAQLLGVGVHGEVDPSVAIVRLAHDVSDLVNHAFNTDETVNLLRRALERGAGRGETAPRGPAEEPAQGREPRVVTNPTSRIPRAEDTEFVTSPPRPEPPVIQPIQPLPVTPPSPAVRFAILWSSADRLFRRLGLSNVTEEAFVQALADKKSEILADGGYAQRPDLLRASEQAQDMAAVFRLASSPWANRADEVTIPVSYRVYFDEFIVDFADPPGVFELIWADSGESAKDSAHETSRKDGVRHEVVSGVRWPGLRGNGEVYMRAKVAIA